MEESGTDNLNEGNDYLKSIHADSIHEEEKIVQTGNVHEEKSTSSETVRLDEEDPSFQTENLSEVEKQRLTLFHSLFDNKNSLTIPTSWNRRQTDKNDSILGIELTQIISRKVDNKILFVSSKKLIVFEDLRVQAEVMAIPAELKQIGFTGTHVSSAEEIENLIKTFYGFKFCTGCASPTSVRNLENSFAVRDCEGRLRHAKCSLIMANTGETTKRSCCESCRKGKRALANKTIRLKKRKEHQRINFKLSPTKMRQLKIMKHRQKIANQRKSRYLRLSRYYKDKLKRSQEEMASLNDKSLADNLSKLKINKSEHTVISEIVEASRCKNSKNRRYSEDWILLCLLFHMRSPAAYRLLRENKILLLPRTSTIRR